MDINFNGINHVTLLVRDKSVSYDFYHNILGFKKYDKTKSLWLVVGTQFIHISDNSGIPFNRGFYHLAITVDEFGPFVQLLKDKKLLLYTFDEKGELSPAPDLDTIITKQQFFLKDPDENLVEFLDEKNTYFNPNEKSKK